MGFWDNSAIETDKMTVKEFLDYLTDENWHTERFVIEAIIDGREKYIRLAMLIWLMHMEYGHMPNELSILRNQIYKEIDNE